MSFILSYLEGIWGVMLELNDARPHCQSRIRAVSIQHCLLSCYINNLGHRMHPSKSDMKTISYCLLTWSQYVFYLSSSFPVTNDTKDTGSSTCSVKPRTCWTPNIYLMSEMLTFQKKVLLQLNDHALTHLPLNLLAHVKLHVLSSLLFCRDCSAVKLVGDDKVWN